MTRTIANTKNTATATVNVRRGMGLFELLFIVLLVGKLAGVFAISWWAVFAPLIVAGVIIVVSLVILFIIAMISD